MDEKKYAGYQEIDHTADLEIRVWGDDLETLFEQAALGMKDLIGYDEVDHEVSPEERVLVVEAIDREGLLVSLLSELLFLLENQHLGLMEIEVELEGDQRCRAGVECLPVVSYIREIKAVTYHNLAITRTAQGWTANLVFDI